MMRYVAGARLVRRISAVLVLGLALPMFVGCDNSTGTPPEMNEADIQKRQADEQAARRQAYGKAGVAAGRNPNKAGAKTDAPAEKPAAAEPAAEKAP